MNIIEYSDELKAKYISSGFNGSCYLTNRNQVFKNFNNPNLYVNNIHSIVGINSSTYVFPKTLVRLGAVIIGYIMDYIDGVEIKYLNKEIGLDEYIYALRIAEYDIASLSVYRISSYDVGGRNIMFSTDNRFKVIDTDFFIKLKSRIGLYSHNLDEFSPGALEPILDVYTSRFYDKRLTKEKEKLIDGKLCPSKYIELLLKYMNIKSSSISVNDFSNRLKLLYKTN